MGHTRVEALVMPLLLLILLAVFLQMVLMYVSLTLHDYLDSVRQLVSGYVVWLQSLFCVFQSVSVIAWFPVGWRRLLLGYRSTTKSLPAGWWRHPSLVQAVISQACLDRLLCSSG